MMKRHVVFGTGEAAQERFAVCWTAIHLGRVLMIQDSQGKQGREERRRDMKLYSALKQASDEMPDALPTEDGAPPRTLKDTGEPLVLEQSQHDRLCALIDRIPWVTRRLEAVEDTLDHLNAAEKVED